MIRRNDDDQRLRDELDGLRRLERHAAQDVPPPDIDAAILARARRDIRSRPVPRRWWVPVSAAATALIAVSLVMRVQQETSAPPTAGLATESVQSDTTNDVERTAPVTTDAPFRQQAAPAATSDVASGSEEPVAAPTSATAEPKVPAPETAERAEVAAREEPQAGSFAIAPGMAAPPAPKAARARAAEASPAPQASGKMLSDADLPGPEEWLARIQRLEAEGRLDEAAAERARLEVAYPGWLEAHSARPQ